MSSYKRLFVFCGVLLIAIPALSKTIKDTKEGDVIALFKAGKSKYVIRYEHVFKDTLFVPQNSEISFEGGRLSGPIVFQNTCLKGNVNLRGSSLKGNLANKTFDASWLCEMDGVSDDAENINQAISICNHVFFPKGIYRLISEFDAKGKVPDGYLTSFKCHIGIDKSDVTLKGEQGTVFETYEQLGVLYFFSQPKQIDKSIRNITVDSITFKVHNDGNTYLGMIHTIKLIGVNGIKITNCYFDDFWGDAICLSHYGDSPGTGERTRNQNVQLLYNTIKGGFHHNTRNGISVVSGKNVIIKYNSIISTSRKDKPGGIDIEPNNSAYTIENILIANNYFEDIWGGGGAIGVCVFDEGPAYRITIKNNVIRKCIEGIQLYIMTENTTSDIVIKNNVIENVKKPLSFEGDGVSRNWTIKGNSYPSMGGQRIPGRIKVENLTVRNNKSE